MSRRYFEGVIKPCAGETFTSWLARGMKSKHGEGFFLAHQIMKKNNWDGTDDCPDERLLQLVMHLLGATPVELRTLFFNPYLLPCAEKYRGHFCAYCVLDDIAAGHDPIIRLRWAYQWYVVCHVHCMPLSYLGISHSLTATHIINALSRTTGDFGTLMYGYRESKVGPFHEPRGVMRWSVRALARIAVVVQQWFRDVLRGYSRLPGSETAIQIGKVFNAIISIFGRKQIKPYEAKTFAGMLVPRARVLSCYYEPDSEALLAESLNVNFAHIDPSIRVAVIAIFGVVLRLPRCVSLWGAFTRLDYHELRAFRDLSIEELRSALFRSDFFDYDLVCRAILEECNFETRSMFAPLLGSYLKE